MEPFIDGGLFEIILLGLASAILNFIYSKRALLAIFSIAVLLAPVLLFFIRQGEAYNYMVTLCLLNAVILTILLWKIKYEKPGEPLFKYSIKQFWRKYALRKSFKRL